MSTQVCRFSSTPLVRRGSSGTIQNRRTNSSRFSHGSNLARTTSEVVVAVVEGRGSAKGEIGIASMDVWHPHLRLAQFSDTAIYNNLRMKLQTLNPSEIIFPDSVLEIGRNVKALFSTLKDELPLTKLSLVPRKHFNQNRAMQMIKNLMTSDCEAVVKDIVGKYYCLASTYGLLSYIEHIQNIIFAPSSIKVSFMGAEKTCIIDLSTAKNLELIVSLNDSTCTDNSLFGLLNRTFTHGGQRMLRANILQPPADLSVAQERLEVVEELITNESAFLCLHSLVSKMVDVDQLVALCSHINKVETIKTAEYKLTQIMNLKHVLEMVEPLRNDLACMKAPLLQTFSKMLIDDRFTSILQRINDVLNDQANPERSALSTRTQKCYAIKSNVNGHLDICRRTFAEFTHDVNQICDAVSKSTNFPFGVGYNNNRGFYLQLHDEKHIFPRVAPLGLIQVTRRGNSVCCTTNQLLKLNDRITDVIGEILMLSNVVVTELLTSIRDSITCLFNLTEALSSLDFLLSLATVCTISTTKMTRPTFADSLTAKNACHPILEKYLSTDVTPNDAFINPNENFVIITGPNMAGKSTYLKMVALLQIMAQMGSFVPADAATFCFVNRIFSRIGQNDELESNVSSFQLERRFFFHAQINDVKYILDNFTDQSLIVIDELCRSTSAEEGLALSWGICEHFIQTKAFVILSTHFLDLASLDSLYPNVVNYHFESQELVGNLNDGFNLISNHTLKRGIFNGPVYGFEIAELSLMPSNVIGRAKSLALEFRSRNKISELDEKRERKEKAAERLRNKLKQAARFAKVTDKKDLCVHLKILKKQYLAEIADC